jgi:hypothetical protein
MKDQEDNINLFSNFVIRESIEEGNYSLCNKFMCSNDTMAEMITRLENHKEVNEQIIIKISYANLDIKAKMELIKSNILDDDLEFLRLILSPKEIFCYLCIAIKCNSYSIIKYILKNIPTNLTENYINEFCKISLMFADKTLLDFIFSQHENIGNSNFKLGLDVVVSAKGNLNNYLFFLLKKEDITLQFKEMIFFSENSIQVESQKIGKEYNLNMLIPITNFCYNVSHSEFFNEIYTSDLKLFDNRDNLEF